MHSVYICTYLYINFKRKYFYLFIISLLCSIGYTYQYNIYINTHCKKSECDRKKTEVTFEKIFKKSIEPVKKIF